jgi:hypothetical protein
MADLAVGTQMYSSEAGSSQMEKNLPFLKPLARIAALAHPCAPRHSHIHDVHHLRPRHSHIPVQRGAPRYSHIPVQQRPTEVAKRSARVRIPLIPTFSLGRRWW